MMRLFLLMALAAGLAGCSNRVADNGKLATECVGHGFSFEQCRFLIGMANKAEDESGQAAALGAVGIGLAAGRK